MRTELAEQLGVEFPILAFSHCRDVVAAVTNAGGLGMLGAIGLTPDELDVELRWIRDEVGDKPFGVDLLLPLNEGEPVTKGMTRADILPDSHVDFVLALLAEHGVDTTREELWGSADRAAEGTQLWAERSASLLDVAFEHPITLIASALGSPSEKMVAGAQEHGVKVAALAGKVQHAERSVARGADIIVAQGTEAGGHTGEISTMVLVPEVVEAVAPVPVVAAGGVGRGRQMAAALALGAQGVWCGSVWLTTEEAETAPAVKDKFLAATSSDTVRSRYRTGKPARQLRSDWTEAWEKPDSPAPLPTPFQGMLAEPALARVAQAALREGSPARDVATYFVGQVVGSMNEVRTTRRVVLDMVEEYLEAVEQLNAWQR